MEMEQAGFLQQLRRRKVVQWGIAYAAGAWGLLQGLEYVTSTFDWPQRMQQFATLGLLLGLPIVLVIAWYHGDRGHQRVSMPEFVLLTGLFLVGGGIFWRYAQVVETAPETVGETATTTTTALPQAFLSNSGEDSTIAGASPRFSAWSATTRKSSGRDRLAGRPVLEVTVSPRAKR